MARGRGPRGVELLAFAPDGRHFYTRAAGGVKAVAVWDVDE